MSQLGLGGSYPSLRSIVHRLRPSSSLRPSPRWITRYYSPSTSLTGEMDHHASNAKLEQSDAINSLRPSAKGQKFKDLVEDLTQRSISLVRLENIQIPSSHFSGETQADPESSKDGSTDVDDLSLKSRRRRRTNFEEDPNFPLDRKRGKKHIMIQLKQAKLNGGGSNQSQKLELIKELDLSIRWGGRLNKVLLSLPSLTNEQSDPASQSAEPVSSNSNLTVVGNSDDINSKQGVEAARRTKGIDEFIKFYLGPLVWSNPKVDISLVYIKDQTKPKITLWLKNDDGLNDDTTANLTTQEIEIENCSRSQILSAILNTDVSVHLEYP